jgi:hypothetical protein
MLDEREKPPPGQEDGFSEMSSAGCFGDSEIIPPRPNTQAQNHRNPRGVREARLLLRRRRLVEHLHRLGPAPLGHFIREIEDAARVDITPRLERYAEIDPEFVRALGGDKFPPRFLHGIGGGRP